MDDQPMERGPASGKDDGVSTDHQARRVYAGIREVLGNMLGRQENLDDLDLVQEVRLLIAQRDAALAVLEQHEPESARVIRRVRDPELSLDPTDESLESLLAATNRPPDGYTEPPT